MDDHPEPLSVLNEKRLQGSTNSDTLGAFGLRVYAISDDLSP